MPPFSLRSSTSTDLGFVYDVLTITLRQHLENSGQVWPEERVQRRLRQHCADGEFNIITLEGQRIGALRYKHKPDEVWLDTLCLLPAWQSLGIGTALVHLVTSQASACGVPVRLHVFRANPARGFWTHQGFAATGEDAHAVHMESAG